MDSETVGLLLTRFTWIGAIMSFFLWVAVVRNVWIVEGSLHHLIARTLAASTLLALDLVVFLIFWPAQFVEPPIELNGDQIRVLVAFVIGNQLMAGFWQVTAPPQARIARTADGRRTR